MSPNQKAKAWLSDLSLIPIEEQKQWIFDSLKAKDMLHIFGRFFFPDVIQGEDTPDCHIELIQELTSQRNSAIIFPRSHAKSTWEKIDTIHDIVYGLEPVIIYISDTLQAARFHFQSIRSQLENNVSLRYVYGDLVPSLHARESTKWTNEHFETTNGVNVVARGANKGRGVNIKDSRPTKIIVDDAETDEQVRSSVRRLNYHEWLYNVIIPSMDKERGRIKVIGTNIHPDCEVMKFYGEHGGIKRAAIENGLPIWPSYWTMEKLAEKKAIMGTRSFNQEFMNDSTSYENARIPAQWIDDNTFTTLPIVNTRLRKVITIDPQSGEKSGADEYAITLLGWYTGDRHRYVLEQRAGRGSQLHQVTEVIRLWLENQDAYIVGAEKVLNQVSTFQLLMDWRNGNLNIDGISSENKNIPVRAISPEGKDKVARFEKHEPMIERGELHLRPEMKVLREQILFLGTDTIDHDDRADSLLYALSLSFERNEGQSGVISDMATKSATIAGNLWRENF